LIDAAAKPALSAQAAALLEHAIATVKQQHPEYSWKEIAGDFRRGSELVKDLALVAETRKPSESEAPGEADSTVAATLLGFESPREELFFVGRIWNVRLAWCGPDG